MAGVTWTRTRTTVASPSTGAIENMVLHVADVEGKAGVEEIRRDIWAIRRFKKPTGRSTNAWTYRLKRSKGVQEVRFLNPAVDRGVNYPRYVHLSGRPKSDLLMFEVDAWAARVFGPRLGEAIQAGYVRLRAAQPLKVERD